MKIQKILVIRFRRIGDATLSVAICSSLKKSFPNAEIHYVLNEGIAPLFNGHPDIDKIVTFNDHDMSSTFRYAKKVRKLMKKEKYDVIIDTRATMKTLLFSWFSLKTPYRIGRKKSYSIFAHNYRIDNHADGVRDTVSLMLDLLNPLIDRFEIVKDNNFRLICAEKERDEYKEYLQKKGIDLNKPIIVCTTTARIVFRVWPQDKMKRVLNNIINKYPDAQLIFNYGGEREKKDAYKLYEAMGSPKQVFIDIEAKNLTELKSLISLASFFFGNEGGTRHIAQSLGIPAFAIYPPNVRKNGWLPSPSPFNQGIDLYDINPKAAADNNLTFDQKLNMIDEESVWKNLDKMLSENLTFNGEKY